MCLWLTLISLRSLYHLFPSLSSGTHRGISNILKRKGKIMNDPFENPPLPYAYDALVPYIDEKTMHLHHDRHLQTYIDNLNATLRDYPAFHSWTLEQLLMNIASLPAAIQQSTARNAGGAYNRNYPFHPARCFLPFRRNMAPFPTLKNSSRRPPSRFSAPDMHGLSVMPSEI